MSPLYPEKLKCRSQDLTIDWYDAAQFSWGSPEAWSRELPGDNFLKVAIQHY